MSAWDNFSPMHKNRLCLVAKENQDRAGLELGQKWTKKKIKNITIKKDKDFNQALENVHLSFALFKISPPAPLSCW